MAQKQWLIFTGLGLCVSVLFFYQYKDALTAEFAFTVDEDADGGGVGKTTPLPKLVPKARSGNSVGSWSDKGDQRTESERGGQQRTENDKQQGDKDKLPTSKLRTTTGIPTPNKPITTTGIPKRARSTSGIPRPTTPITKPPRSSRLSGTNTTTPPLVIKPHGKEADTRPQLCTTEERLDMVQQYCKTHKVAENYLSQFNPSTSNSGKSTANPGDVLDRIPDAEIIRLSHELWLDPENKVIVCMHAKAGCSTWKTILANNTGNGTIGSEAVSGIHTLIFRRGMKCADDTQDAAEIRHRLRTWFKFAIVRHPFDRLVSAYNEKLAGSNTVYQRTLGSKLLNQYQPHLPKAIMRTGKGVPFQDFIQYVLDSNPTDDHFKGPYEDKCHACLFNYNYIVKLETNIKDSHYIISQKLKGRGLDSRTNINSKRTKDPNAWQRGRDLSLHYKNLTFSQFERLTERHDSDLGMYGYAMDTRTFRAKCEGKGRGGGVCC